MDLIKVLVERGIPVDARDCMGNTAMHSAAYCGHVAAVITLHELGGSILASDVNGMTPISFAAEKGHFDVIAYIVTHAGGRNPIIDSDPILKVEMSDEQLL